MAMGGDYEINDRRFKSNVNVIGRRRPWTA
jgi:hypothetical protein